VSADAVELTVDSIAAGGSGVGRTEAGQVVFVPRTAPGDRVVAKLTERHRRWARGRVVEWLAAGPGRVEPPCPIFETCGGCRLQHLDTAPQHEALERVVADALQRIGGRAVPVRPMVAAGPRFGTRNRVTFTLRREQGRVRAGYHAESGPGLIEVRRCLLAEPAIRDAWDALREAWGPDAERLPRGRELRLTLRATATGAVGLFVEGGPPSGAPPPAAAQVLLAATPGLVSWWWAPTGTAARHMGGAEFLEERWDGVDLRLRPRAFLQVNRHVAPLMERHLDAELGNLDGRSVLDLYAGVGSRAIRWARAGAMAVAVEREPDAVETGREAAERAGSGARFVRGTVEAALAGLGAAEAVVVNPPRSGLSAEAADALAAFPARRLAYVSCDPATLARDMKRLATGWAPAFAQPFDAFPHTGHVETVLWLERIPEPDGDGGATGT